MIRSMRALFAILLLAVTLPAISLTPLPPDDVVIDQSVRRFYGWVLAHPGVGISDRETRAKLVPMLTPELASLIESAQQASADAAAWAAPDEKPRMIEGDLFVDSVEGAHEVALAKAVVDGDNATVVATLIYIDPRFGKATRERVVVWNDTLELRRVGPTWRIADVRYRGESERRLSTNLREFVEGQ